MKLFYRLSLYSKILITILIISLSVAGFAIIIFYKSDAKQYQRLTELFYELSNEFSSIDSLMVSNQLLVLEEKLNKLKMNPNISKVSLYQFEGSHFNLIYPHSTNAQLDTFMEAKEPNSGFSLFDKKFEMMYPIKDQERLIGALHIQSANPNTFFNNLAEMIVLIAILSSFIAMYLSEIITKPLKTLATAMRKVTVQNDYTTRVVKHSDDEVGILCDSFNKMLETIQHQESLQRASIEEIKRLAYYDPLTSLPNRNLFKELLNQLLEDVKKEPRLLAVLYIDLDNFKSINDHLGREKGDRYLQKMALDLQYYVQSDSTLKMLSRLEADEFAVVMQNVHHLGEFEEKAQQLIGFTNKDYNLTGQSARGTISIGIAIYPQHGMTVEELIKNAQMAMYVSKEKGKARYEPFDTQIGRMIEKKVMLEQELRHALDRNELLVYFQPKFHLEKQKINGFELLIRWQHPELGMIPPDQFIPIAESSGLIIEIGSYALFEGCKHCKIWRDMGFNDIHVSVNLSGRQFASPHLIATISDALESAHLPAEYLEIELTESTIMMSDDKTLSTLQDLKKIGVRISVDDFGTGYSSLRYLARYPIDVIKIDKSFIMNVNENMSNAMITKTIIDLSHNLNLEVIAEGVELEDQYNFLIQNGCDTIQGYYISKPIPFDSVKELLLKMGPQYATGT